jgi:hypothetical protein
MFTFGTVDFVVEDDDVESDRERPRDEPARRGRISRAAAFRYRWMLLGIAAAVGFVLGYLGLDRYYAAAKPRTYPDFLDLVYSDLKLLGFGGAPSPPPELSWQLQVARFLLPVVVLWGALSGLIALFRDRYQQARLPFLRGHVLVVGLGQKGLAFVQAMRGQAARVVAIDSDATNPNVAAARDAGATVILGDATDAGILLVSGVRRARYLLAVADDATNAEVALQAERLTRHRRTGHMLECLVHVVDPDLCELLNLQALASAHGRGLSIDFFNFHEQAARIACERTLLPEGPVALVGDSPLVEQIALRVAAGWLAEGRAEPRTVSIVDPDARRRIDAVVERHAPVADALELVPVETELDAPMLRRATFLGATDEPSVIYVCATDDALGVEIALALKGPARESGSRVVVCASRSEGLASVLSGAGEGTPLDWLTVLPLARDTCTSELVHQGMCEILGRAVHDGYVEERRNEGALDADDPALAPWEQLLPGFKDSSRAQAAHIVVKLDAIGFELVPLDAPGSPDFGFTDAEVERLARMEHERWAGERRDAGWRYGEQRDPFARTSPYLVSWEALPEDIRDRDRETVHRIPSVVALAGFRVHRVGANSARALPVAD